MADFGFDPADDDGFRLWRTAGVGGFLDVYGAIRVRDEGDSRSRCRVMPDHSHINITGHIHGGFILALVDQAIFCGPFLQGRMPPGGSVTLSASTTFMSPGLPDQPLDAVVEIIGESGRMIFLRGLMEQDGRTVAAFEATLRKTSSRAACAEG